MLDTQVRKFIEKLRGDHPLPLRLLLWNGNQIDLAAQPKVTLKLNSLGAARRLVNPSLASLGEAYVEGELDVQGSLRDLIQVAEELARSADGAEPYGARPSGTKHSRDSDRSAVQYHYDVSNEFYSMWLDPQMVYSCAYFETGDESLADAQTAKLEHICRKLQLRAGESFLDIGCGWGALLIHAARHHGVRAVGVTLSKDQHQLAIERVRAAGLADQIDVRLQDYRDIDSTHKFDKIASVGMFEHVGLDQLPSYFSKVYQLLRPGGLTLIHGITASDPESRSVGLGAGEFIERYVFPDGELPHVSLAIHRASTAGLELHDAESLRRHYSRTLWCWADAFEANLDRLKTIAGDRRCRIWRAYLGGCAHGFSRGWMNIYQLLFSRAHPDGKVELPMSRGYIYR